MHKFMFDVDTIYVNFCLTYVNVKSFFTYDSYTLDVNAFKQKKKTTTPISSHFLLCMKLLLNSDNQFLRDRAFIGNQKLHC